MNVAEKSHGISLFELESGLVDLVREREDIAEGPDSDEKTAQLMVVDNAIREWLGREIRKVDGIRNYIRHCEVMSAAAMEEANCQLERSRLWSGEIRVQGNGGLQPLNITDESMIPEEFFRYEGWISSPVMHNLANCAWPPGYWHLKRVPDTEAIRRALGSKCDLCNGSGTEINSSPTAEKLEQITCTECGGSGHQGVPGCSLGNRGFHRANSLR